MSSESINGSKKVQSLIEKIKDPRNIHKVIQQSLLYALVYPLLLLLGFIEERFRIDKSTVEGEAFGFLIGASKEDCYLRARQLFAQKKILHFLRPSFYKCIDDDTSRFLLQPQELGKVEKYFYHFFSWELVLNGTSSDRIYLYFKAETLTRIKDGRNGDRLDFWPNDLSEQTNPVRIGQTHDEVYENLLKLQQSLFPDMKTRTDRYSRVRVPKKMTPEEYYLIEDHLRWDLRFGKLGWINEVQLCFDQHGNLKEIGRCRSLCEFP